MNDIDKIKIVIVDDHAFVREGMERLLSRVEHFKVIAQMGTGGELLKMLSRLSGPNAECPDVVILDIQMPDISGYALMEALNEYPQIKVLISSMFDNLYSVVKMLHSGAKGFLPKGNRPKEMIEALDRIISGELYYPNYVSPDLVERIKNGHLKVGLTEKEIIFLKYCCEDLGYKEIADRMNLSERTVHHYRDTLFLKLGVKTKTGLAMYAVNSGFAPYK